MMNIKKKSGFTLLEVILSLAMVSIALVVIIQSFSLALRSQIKMHNNIKACFLADKLITQIQIKGLSDVKREGNFDAPNEKFSWRILNKRSGDDLAEIEVFIYGDKLNEQKKISITTQVKKEIL
ncbi:MAG: type II secretion system protein [Candidatus Omnitrophota bacterium]